MAVLLPPRSSARTCANCGAHVSQTFGRVYGDDNDRAHRCPACDSIARLSRSCVVSCHMIRSSTAGTNRNRLGSPMAVPIATASPRESSVSSASSTAITWLTFAGKGGENIGCPFYRRMRYD